PGAQRRAVGVRGSGKADRDRGEEEGMEIIVDCGFRIADWIGRRRIRNPQSEIRNQAVRSSGTRHAASATPSTQTKPPAPTASGAPTCSAASPTKNAPNGAIP